MFTRPSAAPNFASIAASLAGPTEGGISVARNASLAAVIDLFRIHPDLRVLAVVDEDNRPLGIIRELDVRSILFNPYGHALMMNPSFGGTLAALTRPCAQADADLPTTDILDIYAASEHHSGLVLTCDGRYHSTLDNDAYVRLSATRDIEAAQSRADRAERVDAAASAFNAEITEMSDSLGVAANDVRKVAQQLAGNAVQSSEGAASVAAAAGQTKTALKDIGERGRALATTLERIAHDAIAAQHIRSRARGTVEAAGMRVHALTSSTHAIDGMLKLIQDIATKTNFLALNAGMEAARAGPEGHGFAVVASEVKSLARQSSAAAREIAEQVRAIHDILDEVVEGHGDIEAAILAIADISVTTDAALERQYDATRVIAAHVDEAVEAGTNIHEQVHRMSSDAAALGKDASALTRLSEVLASSASQLQDRAQRFVRVAAEA